MTVDITPPPAVVEFAEKHNYKWGVTYAKDWNGYGVYLANQKPHFGIQFNGLPQYILYKDGITKWATKEEKKQIWMKK